MDRVRNNPFAFVRACGRWLRDTLRNPFQLISVLGLLVCLVAGVWMWKNGLLTSREALQKFLEPYGPWAAVLFVAFQAVQVVVPILPGGLGCLAGVVLFGPWYGFVFNYIGICAGSLAAFAIARSCGRPLLYRMFSQSLIDKYDRWTTEGGRFTRWLAFLIFIPVAPDDYLCFLAGTTTMRFRVFAAIIFLCKPAAIAAYSLGLTLVFQRVLGLWA